MSEERANVWPDAMPARLNIQRVGSDVNGSIHTPSARRPATSNVIPAAHGARIGLAGREQVARKQRPKRGIRGNVPPLNVSLELSVAGHAQ